MIIHTPCIPFLHNLTHTTPSCSVDKTGSCASPWKSVLSVVESTDRQPRAMNPLAAPENVDTYRSIAKSLPPWGGELRLKDFAAGTNLSEGTQKRLNDDRSGVWRNGFLTVLPRKLFVEHVQSVVNEAKWQPDTDHWYTVIHVSDIHSVLLPDGNLDVCSVMLRRPLLGTRPILFHQDEHTEVWLPRRCCDGSGGVCVSLSCPVSCTSEYFDLGDQDGIRLVCSCPCK